MAHTYIDTLFEVYPNRTEYLDWIQYELDTRVYYFGNHFKTAIWTQTTVEISHP